MRMVSMLRCSSFELCVFSLSVYVAMFYVASWQSFVWLCNHAFVGALSPKTICRGVAIWGYVAMWSHIEKLCMHFCSYQQQGSARLRGRMDLRTP